MIPGKSCEPNDGMARPSAGTRKNLYRLTRFYDPSGATKLSWGPDAGPRKPMKMLTRARDPLHRRSLP